MGVYVYGRVGPYTRLRAVYEPCARIAMKFNTITRFDPLKPTLD